MRTRLESLHRWWMRFAAVGALTAGALVGAPDVPRSLPEGQLPEDIRLQPLKDLDGYFPFTPADDLLAWAARAEEVRRRIRVALGLWPWPTRAPLNPVIHGRIDRGEYTVEKVYFESMPGFFVTGNLYRPKGRQGRSPGVLCPHGHWSNGRFLETGVEETRREIATGAERFEEGGRSVLQARCVQLARMGCVVFHYDMLGYADSVQIPMEIAHGFAKQRPEMNRPEGWGLFSPQAESHGQSVMGLQTWNSIRALDFLESLDEVDPARIGVTGASGGGTQTFILAAIDSRPAAIFPAVMVSTAMQGGCTCENACGLRVGTGNVEFAALFAPKPLGLTAANDWTKEMPTRGFPELQRHFTRMGAPDRVALTPLLQFGHNYNLPSRTAMYTWFNRHLQLGCPEPVEERDYQRLTREDLSVWDLAHPKPPGGPDFERQLLTWWNEDAQRQLVAAAREPQAFRKLAEPAVATLVGRRVPEAPDLTWTATGRTEAAGFTILLGRLRLAPRGEELPVAVAQPRRANRRVVVWVSTEGKSVLWTPASERSPEGRSSKPSATSGARPSPVGPALRKSVESLLREGVTVVSADLLFQGEFLAEGRAVTQTRRVKNPRESAAYTLGYNHSLFAQRVHDILTVVGWVRHHPGAMVPGWDARPPRLGVVALDGSGPWVAAARAVWGDAVERTVIETRGFRFAAVRDLDSPDLFPGAARYLDLPGLLALGGPGQLLLAGEGRTRAHLPAVLRSAHADPPHNLELTEAQDAALERQATTWVNR